jgi:hypothetical protein
VGWSYSNSACWVYRITALKKLSISASVKKFFLRVSTALSGLIGAFTTTYIQTARFRQYVSLQIGPNVTNQESPSRAASPEMSVRQTPKSKETRRTSGRQRCDLMDSKRTRRSSIQRLGNSKKLMCRTTRSAANAPKRFGTTSLAGRSSDHYK